MQPLSNDLRNRILDAVDNNEESRRKLAARFKINTGTITKSLRLRRETGSYESRPHAGGVAPTPDGDALRRLRRLVEKTPDATLEELRREMGVSGSRMIICRALQGLGLPIKSKTPKAAERDTPEVQEERPEFRERVGPIEPKRLAFADETGVTTAMTPAYGRAPAGERVGAPGPASVGIDDGGRGRRAGRGARPAGDLGGGQRPDVPGLRGAGVRTGVAAGGRGGFRQPDVSPGRGGVEAIERAGASVLRLPPYNPDFNPIERMSAKLK